MKITKKKFDSIDEAQSFYNDKVRSWTVDKNGVVEIVELFPENQEEWLRIQQHEDSINPSDEEVMQITPLDQAKMEENEEMIDLYEKVFNK